MNTVKSDASRGDERFSGRQQAPSAARTVVMACALLAASPAALAQAGSDPIRVLIEQSQYWQSRGDDARARESWEKLLRISPGQPDALYGLGQMAMDENKPDEAGSYLRQLREAHPGSPLIARLEQSIRVGGSRQALRTARSLAQQGRAGEAVAQYQQALGGQAPSGDLALEYYQTLGGSAQGWDEARRGLERLLGEDPGSAAKALALAQHLTYRTNTRADGIRRLAELSQRPAVAQQARESWLRALGWQGDGAAAVSDYQAYVRQYPQDTPARERLEALQRQQQARAAAAEAERDPLRERSSAGFRALEQGDIDAAERAFQAVLSARPGDFDAQGGLGLVRLQQQRFDDARQLLQQASRGGNAARWRQALGSASYWALVRQAEVQRRARNWPQARQLLEQAVAIDGSEPTGQIALADVLFNGGQAAAAEIAYRNVLQREPGNVEAVRGLIGVLARSDRMDEALRLYEGLDAARQQQVGPVGVLRAQQDMAQASLARQRGDGKAERAALERALSNDPASPWVRLDLARLYVKMGAPEQARALMQELLSGGQSTPESLYAAALLAGEMADWGGVLALLERVPAASRSADMNTLQRRAWVRVQAAQGQALVLQGRTQDGLGLMGQARTFAGQDPELLGVVASAYADANLPAQALDMLRQAIVSTVRPQPALWLQYAGILLKTGQDAELAGVLQQLGAQPLDADDERTYQGLRVAYVVRQADALREAGDLAGAYDVLAPLLVELPGNGEAIGALARMYADHGDYSQALALYTRQRQQNPRDLPTLLGAANTAVQAREYRYAESALSMAVQVAPNDPQVLAAMARLYRAQGKNSQAMKYYSAAIAAEQRQAGPFASASGGAAAPAGSWSDARPANPFRAAATRAQPFGAGTGVNTQARMPQQATAALPAYGVAAPSVYGAAALPSSGQPWTSPQGGVAPLVPAASAAASRSGTAASSRQAGASGTAANRATANSGRLAGGGVSGANGANGGAAVPVAVNTAYLPSPVAAQGGANAVVYPAYGGGQAYAGVPQAYALPAVGDPRYAQVDPLDGVDPVGLGLGARTRPKSLSEEFDELRQERAATVTLGSTLRTRNGESGMGKLDDMEVPLDVSVPAGNGKLVFNATMVSLDAGKVATANSLATLSAASRFGAGVKPIYDSYDSTAETFSGTSSGLQNDDGVSLNVGYESERWKADIGTTPLGFRYTSVVGGAAVNGPIGDQLNYKVGVARRAVTDSLLSFAGTRDARTGDAWGGVVTTGVRADLGLEPEKGYGFYGYGSFNQVTGHNVASNSRVETGGGMYYQLIDEPDQQLSSGLNLTLLGFDKNSRYFTLGHGGYFSPQSFLSVSVPIDWSQRTSRLSYRLQGSLGIQHFKEDAVDYFPTSSARQAQALAITQAYASALSLDEDAANARYAGQTKTGLGYSLAGSLEYKIAPQLFVGGMLAVDNASDYRQFTGGLYLRYSLEPQSRPMALPLKPYKSPYSVY